MLNKHLAGGTKLGAQALKNADVNHNNQPDTQDAVKIKAYLAELISKADLAAAGNYKAKYIVMKLAVVNHEKASFSRGFGP